VIDERLRSPESSVPAGEKTLPRRIRLPHPPLVSALFSRRRPLYRPLPGQPSLLRLASSLVLSGRSTRCCQGCSARGAQGSHSRLVHRCWRMRMSHGRGRSREQERGLRGDSHDRRPPALLPRSPGELVAAGEPHQLGPSSAPLNLYLLLAGRTGTRACRCCSASSSSASKGGACADERGQRARVICLSSS
jgi:hypothetical protein